MSTVKKEHWNGREIVEEYIFPAHGTFQAMWEAECWLKQRGYSYGSTCKDRAGFGDMPVAIVKGAYDLPQKWKNFTKYDIDQVDGVMLSDDFRNGSVKILLF